MRFLNSEQRQAVGFAHVIENIDTISRLGHEAKQNVKPYTHARQKELIDELQNTENIITLLKNKSQILDTILLNLHKIKDVKPTINKIGTGIVLDEVELFEIKLFSSISTSILESISDLDIPIKNVTLHDIRTVFNLLDPDNTRFETFYIYDNYSAELKELRTKRREIELVISNTSELSQKDALLMQRSEILDLENEIEYQIKMDLTQKLVPYASSLIANAHMIGYLDFLIAKSKFFIITNAIQPEIVEDQAAICFENMYNPYYDQRFKANKSSMHPISISLKAGVTVLTGANMGGKSIAMKTIALNVLLANHGMYVYAQTAKVPIIEFLYIISDDLQSVEKGLSTFGAEVIQLKTIIGASKAKDGLIILDELARGTNPDEAKIIVNSVIDFFKKKNSYTFISTHFDEISFDGVTHLQVVGISNVNFDKLEQSAKINNKEALNLLRKQMDYSIKEVSNYHIPKNALQIVRLLGVTDLDFDLHNKE